MQKLKWTTHADLAIKQTPVMQREEYLDWMTFRGGDRIPFMELFGPIIGLKEEWEAQGATPEELDFSAFRYRAPKLAERRRQYRAAWRHLPMHRGERDHDSLS